MSEIKLVDGGVYWVRPSGIRVVNGERVDVIDDEPVLALFSNYGGDYDYFHYFGTDLYDRPREVIVVAGPLEIPPPPEVTT